MANTPSQTRKIPAKVVVLVLLTPLCLWLVYRNLLHPAGPAAGALPVHAPGSQQTGPEASRPGALAGGPGQRAEGRDPAPASSADPTLRLDLLQAARSVEYRGSSRNIFQAYVPPPPPPATPPAAHASTAPAHPSAAQEQLASAIPLKFYGTAQSPGNPQRKAFLTDGQGGIYVAQEGDLVAKFYRVIRVGISSVEVEDTRTHVRQQLPLAGN